MINSYVCGCLLSDKILLGYINLKVMKIITSEEKKVH